MIYEERQISKSLGNYFGARFSVALAEQSSTQGC